MDLVCIVCPKGCRIKIENGVVSGNTCKKGEAFAVAEQTCPMRTVCSTVATSFPNMPVLPVRTDGEIPKSKIKELMAVLSNIKITSKVKRGEIVAKNVVGTAVNIIATETIQ
ncbi:MAG: DUF1667 domain-containing protein [Clostridia bacterium]